MRLRYEPSGKAKKLEAGGRRGITCTYIDKCLIQFLQKARECWGKRKTWYEPKGDGFQSRPIQEFEILQNGGDSSHVEGEGLKWGDYMEEKPGVFGRLLGEREWGWQQQRQNSLMVFVVETAKLETFWFLPSLRDWLCRYHKWIAGSKRRVSCTCTGCPPWGCPFQLMARRALQTLRR